MICPNCKQEMKEGYLLNPDQPVQWIPQKERPSCLRGCLAHGAVKLGGGGFWRGYQAVAWYCSPCGFVLVPAKSSHSQNN